MKKIIRIELKISDLNLLDQDELHFRAFKEFNCLGQHFFDVDEPEVDKILGSRAYSGGDIPESVIDEVIDKVTNNLERISYYFNISEGHSFIKYLKKSNSNISTELFDVEEEDWNKEWRKSFRKIKVSKNLSVIPEWEKKIDKENEVYIYPGMGFGTGNHETTYLCLKILDELKEEIAENSTGLDFGCGSGILGISALKIKKMKFDFVDIDSDALDNCLYNLKLNEYEKYEKNHSLILRERFKPQVYDLVFANILEHTLMIESKTLLNSIRPGGYLILSGLLHHQKHGIRIEYSSLEFIGEKEKGEWCALCFRKTL